MDFPCPGCGSPETRLIRSGNHLRRLASFCGIEYFSCRKCHKHFWQSIWLFREFIYVKCPRCYRTKLGTWAESHVRPSTRQQLAILLGARKVRCGACRYSFVSFRLIKNCKVSQNE